MGVTPFIVLTGRQWNRRVHHRRDDVDIGHAGDDALEQLRPHVDDRAHEQPAGAGAAREEAIGRRVATADEIVRDVHEIVERVLLLQLPAVLIPRPTHFRPATNVGDRECKAAIEQREPVRRKRWI